MPDTGTSIDHPVPITVTKNNGKYSLTYLKDDIELHRNDSITVKVIFDTSCDDVDQDRSGISYLKISKPGNEWTSNVVETLWTSQRGPKTAKYTNRELYRLTGSGNEGGHPVNKWVKITDIERGNVADQRWAWWGNVHLKGTEGTGGWERNLHFDPVMVNKGSGGR